MSSNGLKGGQKVYSGDVDHRRRATGAAAGPAQALVDPPLRQVLTSSTSGIAARARHNTQVHRGFVGPHAIDGHRLCRDWSVFLQVETRDRRGPRGYLADTEGEQGNCVRVRDVHRQNIVEHRVTTPMHRCVERVHRCNTTMHSGCLPWSSECIVLTLRRTMVHRACTSDVFGVIAMFGCARGVLEGSVGCGVASATATHRAERARVTTIERLIP